MKTGKKIKISRSVLDRVYYMAIFASPIYIILLNFNDHIIDKTNNENIYKNIALEEAAENNDLIMVKYLIDNGADIHAWHDMAVRWATRKGHLRIIKYLVSKGASIDIYKEEALGWAASVGYLDIVKYLVE